MRKSGRLVLRLARPCRGGPEHVEPVLTAIRTLVESAVGLPDRARPADQVEALVAEHLWFFLVNVNRQADGIVSVEGPALDVTEPGGDGLVIYKDPGGQFQFRLWEIKKHTAHSRMSGTVGRAYTQLSTRATQYLAKYSLVGQHDPDQALGRFYGRLLELWVQADPAAAAGVAIATSHTSVPGKCFQTFATRFPDFASPPRLRGLVASFSDLPRVAERVKDTLWSGL